MTQNKGLEIEVQKKHITKGEEGETNTCAIALALVDHFGLDLDEVEQDERYDTTKDYVHVDSEYIEVRKTNGFSLNFTWSDVPRAIVNFISKFDDDKKKVKPFSFKLPFVK